MESMRDLLRGSLGRSLAGAAEQERLTAAWTVACGRTLAAHARITAFADQTVQVEVEDRAWLDQFQSMRPVLERELARIAAVEVAAIHFYLRRPAHE